MTMLPVRASISMRATSTPAASAARSALVTSPCLKFDELRDINQRLQDQRAEDLVYLPSICV
jgi:hypothetical protein